MWLFAAKKLPPLVCERVNNMWKRRQVVRQRLSFRALE